MLETTPVYAPRDNVNDDTLTVIERCVADRDLVKKDEVLIKAETSKATFDIRAPEAGYIRFLVEEGQDTPVNAPLCLIAPDVKLLEKHQLEETKQTESLASTTTTRFSKKAKEIIKKHNIDESVFAGKGLVRESEALSFLGKAPLVSTPSEAKSMIQASTKECVVENVPFHESKLPRSKRDEGKILSQAHASIISSQVSTLVPTRGIFSKGTEHAEILGEMSSRIIFEVSRLLKLYPVLNAAYRNEHVVYYDEINIGYALDIEEGIKVPVFRQADQSTLDQIHEKKQDFIMKYFQHELTAEDVFGGTFTITDLSEKGTWLFNPVINRGQAAILGVGAEQHFSPGKAFFPIILAFDHRLTEGLLANRFLGELARRITSHEEVLWHRINDSTALSEESCCQSCYRKVSTLQSQSHFLVTTINTVGETRFTCSICLLGL